MLIAADEEYPEVLIKGCHMAGNRARGLLLGSRARMIIEDNYFHIPGAAILFEGDGNFWFEQAGVMLSLEITYLKMEIMVILPGGMLVLLLVAVSLISRVMSAITEES